MTHRDSGRRRLFGRKSRRARPHLAAQESETSAGTAATTATTAPTLTIDALGRKCPIPIIMLAERISEVPIGAVVAVLADDVAAKTDIPAWCRMKSQDFVCDVALDRGWAFHIRRRY